MTTTRFNDMVIIPEVFANNVVNQSLALNAFIKSGIASTDPALNAFLSNPAGGKTYSPRFMGPLAKAKPNVSSDDPAILSVPGKITAIKNTAVRQSLNYSWSSMDLVAALNGLDPIGAIQSLAAEWWTEAMQDRLLLTLQGIIARNIAAEGSDMVVDISGNAGADGLFNAEAFIDAVLTMGDRSNQFTAIAVHSTVLGTMEKAGLIPDYQPQSVIQGTASTRLEDRLFRGRRIIVDDTMTVVGGKYYSYIFQAGAIALGAGVPKNAVEVERNPSKGNGGGEETLFTRQEFIIHPQGYMYKLTDNPTEEHLIDPANWSREWERKRVGIAAMITNG